MSKSLWLKASFVLTVAVSASSAMAQFQGQFNWSPHTNSSPKVQIISPQEGDVFLPGDPVRICADVDCFTNLIAGVSYWAGTNHLGDVTHSLYHSDVYCLTVTNLDAGDYTLTAIATDTGGNSTTSSVVDISVVTNLPPRVRLVAPRDGAVILGPTNIQICAAAFDPDGTVADVEFFAGTNSLGVLPTPPPILVTNRFGVFTVKQPYSLTWSNVSMGTYTLTAVATDNDGATATSAPVSITVVTDLPPAVRILLPENGMRYPASAPIPIHVIASDPDGSVASVQFFADSMLLGSTTTPVPSFSLLHGPAVYSLTWSNAAAGAHVLTAVATDNAGLSSTSAPVKLTVLPPPQPKVVVVNPRNGEVFHNAPANIDLCAFEHFFTNAVVQMQFFAGASVVATTTNTPYSCVIWSNVPPGAYTLTAVAADSGGVTATSAPVNINVVTNRTPPWYWGH